MSQPASSESPEPNSSLNITGGENIIHGDMFVGDKIIHGDQVAQKIIFTEEQAYDVRGCDNPYLGLSAFTYADANKYAGREKLIAETVTRITTPASPIPLLFITGASGSGKSSFAQAGLLPALERFYDGFTVKRAVIRPAGDPLAALNDALWRQLQLPLIYRASADANRLMPDRIFRDAPPNQINLLVLDQFEEFFTQAPQATGEQFFAWLANLPPFSTTRTHIIATLRADYLPELFNHPALYEIAKHGVDLRAMNGDELVQAIQQPLYASRYAKMKKFEPSLVGKLAEDTAQDAAFLPLLQVTLQEIWRRGFLKRDAYANLTHAIKHRADQVLEYCDFDDAIPNEKRDPDEQVALLNLLLDLVDVSLDDDARHDVRKQRAKGELTRGDVQREQWVKQLSDARLLSVRQVGTISLENAANQSPSTSPSLSISVDLIHETLLTNWTRLQTAIADRRNDLRRRTRFEQNLDEWKTQNHSDEYLLDGVRLAEARELGARDDIAFQNEEAQAYLRASVAKAEAAQQAELVRERQRTEALEQAGREAERSAATEKQRGRILRIATIGLTFLLLLTGLALIYAFQQQREAVNQSNIALARLSRELAANSLSNLDLDPELSLMLAIEALKTASTREAADALTKSLLASHVRALMRGHTGPVYTASFSPDGSTVVTASNDKTARVWDARTGQLEAELRGHTGPVYKAFFSPDGKWIVTASEDMTARIWEASTGRSVSELKGHTGWVISAIFNPDEKLVLTASGDGTARIWEAVSGKLMAVLKGNDDAVSSAAFSPDGGLIATAGYDRIARIWDTQTGGLIHKLEGHTDKIRTLEFSSEGNLIVTAGFDHTAIVWDVKSGRSIARLLGHTDWVWSASFSPNGKLVATASKDGTARVWESASGKMLAEMKGHKGPVNDAQFSPDGRFVITASDDHTAQVWDMTSGKNVLALRGHIASVRTASFSPDGKLVLTASDDETARVWTLGMELSSMKLLGHSDIVWDAQFSPDGMMIITSSQDAARIWNTSTGQSIAELRGSERVVYASFISPDGKLVVTTHGDGIARVWEVPSGRLVTEMRGHTGPVNYASFTPDGMRVVTASRDGTARVWDARTGKSLIELRGHKSEVWRAALSLDGRFVVTSSLDETARVWEASTGHLVAEMRGHTAPVIYASFNSDGKRVITASQDGTARVWDTYSGKEIIVLAGHKGTVNRANFSLDGKLVITSSEDGTARIWDVSTGRVVAQLVGHTGSVWTAILSRDERLALTASEDGTARLWDASTGESLAVLRGDTGPVKTAVFSPNGRLILTASNDATAQIYSCEVCASLGDLLTLAHAHITRSLSSDERAKYLHEGE